MIAPSRSYMSVAEAATYVGCHPQTIRRWLKAGRIQRYQVGGLIRVDQNDLDQRMAGD
ncbi:MAG: helix-turn-helix domain-containing protein [Corynebacterium sp.]|uniref:helix-turn-helix domain-containing protein n=1 Tax=Corynebacterium sp. TaxID=1720 RepID=UPI00096A3B7D